MTYQPPVRDYAFLLRDVLQLERYANLPAFADASMDTVDQILEEAGRFTGEVLAPLNSVGDKEGCHWKPDFTVTTPSITLGQLAPGATANGTVTVQMVNKATNQDDCQGVTVPLYFEAK